MLTDRAIESREGEVGYVRDVGVAGSNPVTPTIDFLDISLKALSLGSMLRCRLGSSWGPVSSALSDPIRLSIAVTVEVRRGAGCPAYVFPVALVCTRLASQPNVSIGGYIVLPTAASLLGYLNDVGFPIHRRHHSGA